MSRAKRAVCQWSRIGRRRPRFPDYCNLVRFSLELCRCPEYQSIRLKKRSNNKISLLTRTFGPRLLRPYVSVIFCTRLRRADVIRDPDFPEVDSIGNDLFTKQQIIISSHSHD